MLSSATLNFPTSPSQYAAQSVPSFEEFQSLWTAWDIVTKAMVPREELLSKPIKLRNALIFYLGHIPTFLGQYLFAFQEPGITDKLTRVDVHLTRALGEKPTHPKSYRLIFERGIDPDVDDPEKCHSHSEIPDEWPALGDILDYQVRVRSRVRSIFEKHNVAENRVLGEALWIGFEHEAMHLETFLYMLIQSERTLSPPAVPQPDFEKLFRDARQEARPNEWFSIPEQTLLVGLDDDGHSVPRDSFGWDNEKPQRKVTVKAFEAQARPITNGEYAKYLQANHLPQKPESWVLVKSDQTYPTCNGVSQNSSYATNDFMAHFAVRTVFGSVPLELAQDWPVIASYDELAKYAKWVDCRIPTFEEAKSIYAHAARLKETSNGLSNGHR